MTSISGAVHTANEATAAETVRVTNQMTQQCKRLSELGREFVRLCETDPETLTGEACGDQAYLISQKRKEIVEAINELAVQPVVTKAWAQTYLALTGAEAAFEHRYTEWSESEKSEQSRKERALEYREQLHQDQALHEQRLRGKLV